MKKAGWIFLFLSAALGLAAENLQKIVSIDSEAYKLIDLLYMEQGLSSPSGSRPWSEAEFRKVLKKLDTGKMSKAGEKSYYRLMTIFEKKPDYTDDDGLVFSADIKTNLEFYKHFKLSDESSEAEKMYYWNYGYESRKDLLEIPMSVWLADRLFMQADLKLREEYRAIDNRYSPDDKITAVCVDNYTNIPPSLVALDLYLPLRAFIAAGGDNWAVQFGRDRMSWGNGKTGDLMFSSNLDFHDSLCFTTFWKDFKFTSFYTVFDTNPRYDADSSPEEKFIEEYLAVTAHRFEFRIKDRFNIALSEALAFAKKGPELVVDLSPLIQYHGFLKPDVANSLLTIELDWALNPYLNLYTQIAVDEFVTFVEEGRNGGALGYMAGAAALFPLADRFLSLNFEAVYLDPMMYNRRTSPYYVYQRRMWSFIEPMVDMYVRKPSGYYLGPDVMAFYLGTELYDAGDWTAGLEANFIIKGEKYLLDYDDPETHYIPEFTDSAPTGTPEYRLIVKLSGEKKLNKNISLASSILFINIDNYRHNSGINRKDIETAFSVSYSF